MRFIVAAIFLSTITSNAYADSILGGWYGTNEGQAQGTVAVIFLADGEYVEVEDGSSILDPSGQNGMERGTYSWNPVTGAFSKNTLLNTDGEWGLSDSEANSVTVSGNVLTAATPQGTFQLARVSDPTSQIVGSWYFTDNPAPGDLTVLTLLPNGQFLLAIDPPSGGYMEFGNYAWNKTTNAFVSSIVDSTAPAGLAINLPAFTSAGLLNGNLVLSSSLGSTTFAATVAPEPGTYATPIMGLGLAVFIARRKKQKTV